MRKFDLPGDPSDSHCPKGEEDDATEEEDEEVECGVILRVRAFGDGWNDREWKVVGR